MKNTELNYDCRKMSEVTSTTWKKMLMIPTKAKTVKGLVKAVLKDTDMYDSEEAVEDVLFSEWATICKDGIIIWMDEC